MGCAASTRVAPRVFCDELVTALRETVEDPKSHALAKDFFTQIQCFTFEDLQLLREEDLIDIKLPMFTRRKLWAKIGNLKNKFESQSIARDSSFSAGTSNPGPNVNKPRCIISYRTADKEKLDELMEITAGYGFEGWHGGMVVAAGDDWMTQWIEAVEDQNTPIVVFMLSQKFVESDACTKEFQWVFGRPNLQQKAVPIMLEEFELPKEFQFHLMSYNYIHGFRDGWFDSLEQALRAKLQKLKLHEQYPDMALFASEHESGGIEAEQDLFEKTLERESKKLRDEAKAALKGLADHVALVGIIGSTNFKYSQSPEVSKLVCEQLGRKLADVAVKDDQKGKVTRAALVTGGCTGVGAVTARAFHKRRMERKWGVEEGCNGLAMDKTATFAVLPQYDPSPPSNAPLAHMNTEGKKRETYFVPEFDGSDPNTNIQGSFALKRPSSADSAHSVRSRGSKAASVTFGDWPQEDFGCTKHIGSTDKARKRFLAEAIPIIIFIEGGPGALFEATSAHSKNHIVLPLGCLGGMAHKFASEHGSKIKKMMQGTEEINLLFDNLQNCRVFLAPKDHNGPLCSDAIDSIEELDEQLLSLGWDSIGPTVATVTALTVEVFTDKVVQLLRLLLPKLKAMITDHGLAGAQSSKAVEQGFDMLKEWQQLHDPPVTVLEPDSALALADYIKKCGGHAVLIDGHGTKNQYKDMTLLTFEQKLEPVVAHLNKLYKKDKWVAVYGGDPYNPGECVDASYIVYVLHHKFGVKIIATQADVYGKYIVTMEGEGKEKKMKLNPQYICLNEGAVMLYKTQYRENLAGQQEIMYGGLDDKNTPCGASALWLHKDVLSLVRAHLVMGGGVIAQQNAKLCLNHHKRVIYIPCAAKIVLEDKQRAGEEWYGQVHDFMEECAKGMLSKECWCKVLVAPAQPKESSENQSPVLSSSLLARKILSVSNHKTSILHQLLPFIELQKPQTLQRPKP